MGLGVEQELSGAFQFGKKREEKKIDSRFIIANQLGLYF